MYLMVSIYECVNLRMIQILIEFYGLVESDKELDSMFLIYKIDWFLVCFYCLLQNLDSSVLFFLTEN